MNEHPPPLSSEHVDELLSAELDGEFDAAALDLGFDPGLARDALDAMLPDVEARRRELAQARDAVAVVPPLDELTAARLRARALEAGSESHDELTRTRRRRAWMSAAGVAAAFIAVLGVAAVVTRSSSKSSTVNAASGASSPDRTALGATPENFGTVANGEALGARVQHRIRSVESTHTNDVASPAFNAQSSEDYSFTTSEAKISALPAAACDRDARKVAAVDAVPFMTGTATVARTPVTVFVYRRGSGYVLVASDSGCRVIAHRSLAR